MAKRHFLAGKRQACASVHHSLDYIHIYKRAHNTLTFPAIRIGSFGCCSKVRRLQPSSSILFEWAHMPASASQDDRCMSAAECSQHAASLATLSSNSAALISAADRPCGWAAARQYPCLSPVVYTWVSVTGSAALVAGTALYTRCFQSSSYRAILAGSQLLLVVLSLGELLWVLRINLMLGVPE